MPRFARLFEAAADTLNAYYQAVAEGNIDSIMAQQRFHMSRGKLTYKEPIEADKFVDQSYLRRALAFVGPYKP